MCGLHHTIIDVDWSLEGTHRNFQVPVSQNKELERDVWIVVEIQFAKREEGHWRDGSVSRVLVAHARGPKWIPGPI